MERECMGKINNYCQKRNLNPFYMDIEKTGPPHNPKFTVALNINGEEYGRGTGKSKKEARAVAAKEAWEKIEKQLENPSNVEAVELMKSPVILPVTRSNYIGTLNRYSQKTLQLLDFPDRERIGDDHAPMFSCRCTISGVVYGTGTGPSLAAAKQAAAKQACEKLIEEGCLTMESEESNTSSSQVPTESDSDSVCFKDTATQLEEKMKEMAICKEPSSSQRNARSCALKPNRKLAANFDNAKKKEGEKKKSHSDENLPDLDKNTSEVNGSSYTMDETFLKNFKNIELIGEGGFGNVFKATAKLDGLTYAVKRVPLKRNVNREVEQLARLKHENIVQYHWSWEGKDCVTYSGSRKESGVFLFITMEFCEKGTLENWIKKNREDKKYHEMAQNKFLQILEGVKYIHSKGLMHRDLKPQNIFISREDKIKIGDFGLVTSVENETVTENIGTKPYMAPEQVGDSYGKAVDIYALGLIWFEILSAFSSHHERNRIWHKVREGELPRSFSEQFLTEASIIKKMLSKEPSGRLSVSEIVKFAHKDDLHKRHTQ
ncbi:interferon-induced, double-stranded RNA-activated protein kinase isoform X1 [Calypte anna]|uniref:interferon-induced, double-stranded RNA-activated protein kinase isoform X1 n=2 Tax=Calypte anna TaxID=9244 RepID=UPI0004C2A6C7|nr:interferon-induced, double-stranded RNA-activated protein kinase isoform X1 [Calypte anna]